MAMAKLFLQRELPPAGYWFPLMIVLGGVNFIRAPSPKSKDVEAITLTLNMCLATGETVQENLMTLYMT
jgi:hypothetical protein